MGTRNGAFGKSALYATSVPWNQILSGPFVDVGPNSGASYPTATAAYNAGATFVWMLPGTYTDTPTIPAGGALLGPGAGAVVFQPTILTGAAIRVSGNASNHSLHYIIDGITVVGTNASAGCYGILATDTIGLHLGERLIIQNFVGAGSEGFRMTTSSGYCENWKLEMIIQSCTTGIHFVYNTGASFIRGWYTGSITTVASGTAWMIDASIKIDESNIYGRFFPLANATCLNWNCTGAGLRFFPAMDVSSFTGCTGISIGSSGKFINFGGFGPTFDGTGWTATITVASGGEWGLPPATIGVSASPFAYTLPIGVNEAYASTPTRIVIYGGTVSSISITRNGASSPVTVGNATNCSHDLLPGDTITVTYSSAPTMVRYPVAG